MQNTQQIYGDNVSVNNLQAGIEIGSIILQNIKRSPRFIIILQISFIYCLTSFVAYLFQSAFSRQESEREMTLVLSMNPFLDPEGDPPLSTYQPIWESERCTKTCLSNPAPPRNSEEQFTQGTNTKHWCLSIHSLISAWFHLVHRVIWNVFSPHAQFGDLSKPSVMVLPVIPFTFLSYMHSISQNDLCVFKHAVLLWQMLMMCRSIN